MGGQDQSGLCFAIDRVRDVCYGSHFFWLEIGENRHTHRHSVRWYATTDGRIATWIMDVLVHIDYEWFSCLRSVYSPTHVEGSPYIVRPKCTLAASHAAALCVTMSMPTPTGQTDRQTDGRTPDRYITLTARRGQRYNLDTNVSHVE